eukprot:TRINITY_DN368_c0_g1_i1.p1 TRINITY_DN368_c0_g1~~TRINITY_DN368_c0_g1_i1.p1  ORF type:complete len:212 (-),score=57.16 TRINITY_DN368_c0_g1_i1:221-856(-)
MSDLKIISQGAEAKVYRGKFNGKSVIVKERFAKQYRHPELDKSITASRLHGEVRSMVRAMKAGVDVPAPLFVDSKNSRIFMEDIPGLTIKQLLWNNTIDPETAAAQIGLEVAKLHNNSIIHGDLTTSNLFQRSCGRLVVLDFGLSYQSTLVEDMAVDIYVLERAFLSTHPNSEELMAAVLAAYSKHAKTAKQVLSRLDLVRLRGRKRSMIG